MPSFVQEPPSFDEPVAMPMAMEDNIVSDSYHSNNINLAKIKIHYNDSIHGYSMNIESYAYPYNFKFGKPMDYHD